MGSSCHPLIAKTIMHISKTDIMAKEIAKIEPPYMYHSMAEVLNMEISLPSDATRGHLFFRFEFEDGSVMDSQDFKVYQE